MLAGPTAAPTLRWPEVSGVEELLAHEVRDPVEELLLRAVLWVGRATAAESPEDQGLLRVLHATALRSPLSAAAHGRPDSAIALRTARRRLHCLLTEVARIDVTPSSDEDGAAPTIDRHEKAQDRRRGVSAVGQATPMPAGRRRGRWSDAAISRSFREVFAAASRFTSGDGRAQIHFGTCLLYLIFRGATRAFRALPWDTF